MEPQALDSLLADEHLALFGRRSAARKFSIHDLGGLGHRQRIKVLPDWLVDWCSNPAGTSIFSSR